jgi:hypothetical protein
MINTLLALKDRKRRKWRIVLGSKSRDQIWLCEV